MTTKPTIHRLLSAKRRTRKNKKQIPVISELAERDRKRIVEEVDVPESKRAVFLVEIENAIVEYSLLLKSNYHLPTIKQTLRNLAKSVGDTLKQIPDENEPDADTSILVWLLQEYAASHVSKRSYREPLFMQNHFTLVQQGVRETLAKYLDILNAASKDPQFGRGGRPKNYLERLFTFFVLSAYVKATGHTPTDVRESEPYRLLVLCFELAGYAVIDPYTYYTFVIDNTHLQDC